GGEGKTVRPGDPRAFAEACQEMLDLPAAVRRRLGLCGRKRIQTQYSIQSVVARYEEFYEQLAGYHLQPGTQLTGTI
ncbi:MAG: hypothetical protein JO166_19915, partial [Deltaproteobacteria bacterium]|nr:hypothetical protein [Deltaproteobacteria bacterium]